MADINSGSLRTDLTHLLGDSASKFDSDKLDLFLDMAARDLPRVAPRVVRDTLTLSAGVDNYPAPDDLLRPLMLHWGAAELRNTKPWDDNWPGKLPRLGVSYQDDVSVLTLTPPPTDHQINCLGAQCTYSYSSRHTIDATVTATTISEDDRPLLLVRAMVEALLALAVRGITKPVTLGGKAGLSIPKNGTPAALSDQLMKLFEKMAA